MGTLTNLKTGQTYKTPLKAEEETEEKTGGTLTNLVSGQTYTAKPLPTVETDPIKSAASALKTALPMADTNAKTLFNLSNVMTGGTLPVVAGTGQNGEKYAQAAQTAAQKKTAQQEARKANISDDFSGDRTYAGGGRENNQFSVGKLLDGVAVKGADEFVSGLTSTAAWLENMTLGKLFPGTTDNSIIQAINDRVQQAKEHNKKYTAPNVAAGGKAAEIIDKYGTATVAAIPQAVLALYTGGASTAAQGTTAGLQAASTAAQASGGLMSTVKSAVTALSKDPQYWLSFAQVAGNSYDQAKADGADDTRASLYALGNGLMNAAVEVGGGIETLPAELQGGKGAFKTWVNSMLDEGKEEVVQGVLERGLQNLIYGKDNPLMGIEDENAILNPNTAGEEFLGGAVVGGILSGAQTGINAVLNAGAKSALPMVEQTTEPTTLPMVEQVGTDTSAQNSAVEGAQGQNNTASTGETVISDYQKTEHHGNILDAVRANMNAVSTMRPVASITGNEFQKTAGDTRNLRTKVIDFFNSIGNKVVRQDIGEIELNTSGARDSLAHGYGKLKAATFSALPQVLQNGQIIEQFGPYEGHGYDSTIISAPVKVGNETVYVGALVIKDTKQRYKLHEVLVANESGAPLFQSESTSQNADVPLRNDTPLKASEDAFTDPTILKNEPGVNRNSAQNSDNIHVDLPMVDGYGRNTVGSAQAQFAYQEAPSQSVADRIFTEQEMQNHDLESKHQVYSNAQSRADAELMLDTDYEGEVERLKTEEWGPAENVEGHRILENLVEQARKTGAAEDWAKVKEWKQLYDRKGGTEAGQTLQSRAQFADSAATITAEAADFLDSDKAKELNQGKCTAVMETVAEQSEALENIAEGDTDALIDLIERNSEIRRTTGLFRKSTSKQMDWALHKVAELYPDADSFLRGVAADQTRAIYTDYAKVSLTEKAKSLRVQFMLSKISTIMRNLVSNNVFDPLETLSNDVGLLADLVMSKATGQRTTAFEKLWLSKAKRHGSLEGALKSFIEVGLDADSEYSSGKYEGTSGRTFKMTGNPIERFLSTWSKFQSYTLTTTDEFQKGGIRAETQESINKLKESGKLDADSLNEWADETARQRTFQNDSAPALLMEDARKTLNRIRIKDVGAGDIMVPFARVPGNLVAQAANYSPVGIANGVRQMAQVMYDAKDGNYSAEAQAQAARNIGRGLTGTGLLAAFTALAAKGLIDVAGADDEDKEALEKAQGRNGTQWNLSATLRAAKGESTEWQDGDVLMSIGFLDPINSIMAAGAMIADAYKEDGTLTAEEITDASLSALVQAVLDLPAMSSINDLITTAEYADGETAGEKAWNTAKDYAAGEIESFIIPNALRGIATGLDDTVRNRYSGEGFIEQAKEGVISGTPFARQTLPASLDPFGREKTQTGNTVMNMLNNNLLPGALTKYKETDVEKTLENVYDATGNASVYPTKKAPNSFEIDGEKFTLDAEQKDEFMTTAGKTALEIMMDMIDSDNFQRMNEETQGQYLAVANEYARAVAKAEVSDGKYELSGTNKKIADAEDAGLSAADYIMYKLNSEEYNEDGEGTMKISEVAEAIRNSGMSKKEQTAYWLVTYPEWPEKAEEKGVDIEDYINYKQYTYGVEGDKNAKGDTISGSVKKNKIAALVKAGYTQSEAEALYKAVNAKN